MKRFVVLGWLGFALTGGRSQLAAQYSTNVLADGPIHYFRLEESALASGASDLGTLGGSVGEFDGGITLNQASVSSALGRCARFDGNAGTFVDLGPFHAGDALSVEAWVNLDPDARPGSYHAIIARWDGSYELDLATDDRANLVVRNQANAFGLAASAAPVPRGLWHHLVGTFASGTLQVFVDGVPGAPVTIGGTLRDGGPVPDRVLIGGTRDGASGSYNWKGLLDEVVIYNHALSPNRILAHLNGASVGTVGVAIERSAFITWPAFPPGLMLQVADPAQQPPAWRDVLLPRVLEAGYYRVAVPAAETNQAYRLAKP